MVHDLCYAEGILRRGRRLRFSDVLAVIGGAAAGGAKQHVCALRVYSLENPMLYNKRSATGCQPSALDKCAYFRITLQLSFQFRRQIWSFQL